LKKSPKSISQRKQNGAVVQKEETLNGATVACDYNFDETRRQQRQPRSRKLYPIIPTKTDPQ